MLEVKCEYWQISDLQRKAETDTRRSRSLLWTFALLQCRRLVFGVERSDLPFNSKREYEDEWKIVSDQRLCNLESVQSVIIVQNNMCAVGCLRNRRREFLKPLHITLFPIQTLRHSLVVHRPLIVVLVVLLPLEPLGGIPFTVSRRNVGHQTGLLGHRHHGAHTLLLALAQPGDTTGQHAAIRSYVLPEDQDVRVFDIQSQWTFRAEDCVAVLCAYCLGGIEWFLHKQIPLGMLHWHAGDGQGSWFGIHVNWKAIH